MYRMALDWIPQEERKLASNYTAISETFSSRLESTTTKFIIINMTLVNIQTKKLAPMNCYVRLYSEMRKTVSGVLQKLCY